MSLRLGGQFSPCLSGRLTSTTACYTSDGSIVWEYDTNREFTTVNGVAAKGASLGGHGPAVAGGMVFVSSGYGAFGGRAGNVLLAFGLP